MLNDRVGKMISHKLQAQPVSTRQAKPCPHHIRAFKSCRSIKFHARAAADAGVNPFATSSTASSSVTEGQPSSSSSISKYGWSSHIWKWRGHTIHYKTAGCGEPIVMVHGFGLSSFHYRRNIPVLAEKYKVRRNPFRVHHIAGWAPAGFPSTTRMEEGYLACVISGFPAGQKGVPVFTRASYRLITSNAILYAAQVYAIDLLGFGKSSKPITQYR